MRFSPGWKGDMIVTDRYIRNWHGPVRIQKYKLLKQFEEYHVLKSARDQRGSRFDIERRSLLLGLADGR